MKMKDTKRDFIEADNYLPDQEFLTDAGAMQALLDGKTIQEVSRFHREKGLKYRINKRSGALCNKLGDPSGPFFVNTVHEVFGTAGKRFIVIK